MWMARENWVDEEEWSEESSGRKRRVTYAATKYSVSLRFLPLFAGIPACPIFTVSIHRSSFTATLLDIIMSHGRRWNGGIWRKGIAAETADIGIPCDVSRFNSGQTIFKRRFEYSSVAKVKLESVQLDPLWRLRIHARLSIQFWANNF